MAQDPYGFKEERALRGGGPASGATLAMWTGVGAAMLSAVGFCACYLPFFVALPLGAYAAWTGYQNLDGDNAEDTKGRSMALAGMLSGMLATFISGAILLFILLYVGVLFFAMFAGMAAESANF